MHRQRFTYLNSGQCIMKKLLVSFLLLIASNSQATVINFDDITLAGTYDNIQGLGQVNYAGFIWDIDWFVGDTSHHSTYANSATSGSQYLSNGQNSTNLTISSNTLFDFDGAWVGAPTISNPASWVNITAYDLLNNVIGSTGNVAINNNMSWINGGFENVSYLNITRENGWFTLDDFTVNSNSSVIPEPSTISIIALAMLGFAARRVKR